jgi:NAD(P)-dependent dehydrogenase (short-subunit alcohol dehydrogenase family)
VGRPRFPYRPLPGVCSRSGGRKLERLYENIGAVAVKLATDDLQEIESALSQITIQVVLADINENAVRSAAEELVSAGHQAIAIHCNVVDEAEVAAMIEQTVATFGRLDAAYNNAGVMTPAVETADASGEDFERVTAINLRGVWNCMKYELRQMREQGSGAIVNCSSIGGLTANPNRAIYGASKFGVIGLTKSAALEYAARGIRINAVCPGTIETPMVTDMVAKKSFTLEDAVKSIPIGRTGQPEEIASAVLWLCSPGASFVIGHALVVDGGYTA